MPQQVFSKRMNKRTIHFTTTALLACFFFLVACTQENEPVIANGKLHFTIGQVSSDTETRAIPAELPAPAMELFNLTVQRQEGGSTIYKGDFKSELELPVGVYSITASYGDNPIVGRDAPYYIGTAEATVSKDQATAVTIPCRVGNALISVEFGQDETERARFDRYYSYYGLLVQVGTYSMTIDKDETATSIYFPAGSTPTLTFYGTLASDGGRQVSVDLTHTSLPTTFQAADHAKLTLTLPDPASALGVNISKLALETVRLDETIPLSWLPVATVIPSHQYKDGMLMGTDLTFTSSYPGMTWEARVSNAEGDTIRRITGQGELTSNYTSSTEWPYLPAGKYKATYFLHSENGVSKANSREFMIPASDLSVTIGGYTSYDKYLEGDIAAANASNGHSLYNPSVSVNIAPSLVTNSRYGFQMHYNLNGTAATTTENMVSLGTKTLDAQLAAHNLAATVAFAGQEAGANRDFHITGLPLAFEPPTSTDWESSGDYVTFNSGYVRLGQNAWNSEQYITYSKIAIPAGTRVMADYKVQCNSAAFKADFTLYLGELPLVSGTNNETLEAVVPLTLSSATTHIRCQNEGGQAAAYADVYRVALRYSE